MKFGIIRERKNPPDRRTPLTPSLCADFRSRFPDHQVVVESSPDRIFSNETYQQQGIPISTDLSDCDVLLGVKEVPVDYLIPHKTYLFFSHTIKAQPYNRHLLQTILEKNIRLIDYECLAYPNDGGRILGFGYWAGVVGAYNGLLTWGKKYGQFELKPAYKCANYDELRSELSRIQAQLPPIRIGLTGTGRVATGALDILNHLHIQQLNPEELKDAQPASAVFVNFRNEDIYTRTDDPAAPWDVHHFYHHHENYTSQFQPYLNRIDLLINGFYWEPTLPALFAKEDTAKPNFAIKVIADITCDVEGSVPITLRATYPHDPTFGWNPATQAECEPYQPNTIDVMAVTVLPVELPADSSQEFGQSLLDEVIPLLIKGDQNEIIQRATITENGHLTSNYQYLKDFVKGD